MNHTTHTYLINFLLTGRDKAYSWLFKAIEEISNSELFYSGNTWIVQSEKTAEQVKEVMLPFLSEKDSVGVFELGKDWVQVNGRPNHVEWLEHHL